VTRFRLTLLAGLIVGLAPLAAQEKSVKPGINDPFKNPDLKEYQGKFEVESREVYAKRKEIVGHCKLKPGMVVADVGAGTGLFTRLFAAEVGEKGKVYAVDISKDFLDHISRTAREQKLSNIETVLGTDRSVELKPESVDLVYICDTYHHFEFPYRTMESIHKALKPGGQLVVIDFHRIPGKSREWILGHVRAGQEVVEREITETGFKKVDEIKGLLEENYFIRFEKVDRKDGPK
jgi:ubiquinone/menaquinone biosynthesis C-methylase UbiE